MVIRITKQGEENPQSLVRRFSRRVQQSGILRRARKLRYKERPKSKQLMKRTALRKEEVKKEYSRKVKMGEIKKTRNF